LKHPCDIAGFLKRNQKARNSLPGISQADAGRFQQLLHLRRRWKTGWDKPLFLVNIEIFFNIFL